MSSSAYITRYLERRLSAFGTCPEIHVHQIEAHERMLALARVAADSASYYRELAARDLTLAAMRAEWLDRHRNAACVHAAVGDDAAHGAAMARVRAGMQGDFLAAIAACEQEIGGALAAARAARAALAPFLMSLLDWRLAGAPVARGRSRTDVRGLWAVIQHGDPGCTWARICSHPAYRHRLPFDQAGLDLLGTWLAEALAGEADEAPAASHALTRAPREEPVEPPAEPGESRASADARAPGLAHAYRVAYEAQDWSGRDCTRRAYERILALEAEVERDDPQAGADLFLCRLAEDDLLDGLARAPHLDLAEELRAHCAGRSQPILAHHAAALATAVANSHTATAVEFERARLDAWFDVESAWDQLLVHYALGVVTTVLGEDAPGKAAAIREGLAATTALFGAPWDAVLATPRLREFFARELVPAMFGRRPRAGARLGETGVAVVHAAAEFGPRAPGDDPGRVRDYLASLVHTAADAVATRPGAARPLVLWGEPVPLAALAERLATPPRPSVVLVR